MINNAMIVVGNLTRDIELKFLPSGKAIATGSVAQNNRRRNPQTNEWEDGDTTFVNVTLWEQLAENAAASLTKGVRVVVVGTLKQRSWEDADGNKRSAYDLIADAIGPDLRFATATVDRNDRSKSSSQGGTSGGGNTPPPPPDYGDEEPF